ncbi:MAG: amidohydrolase, partial [Nitratireductor sp.]|nr:amidohydrolase [Nitratireductor sp.]
MPVINRIAEFHKDMAGWRQDIHAHPETAFEEERTSKLVAETLTGLGIETHTGIAKTGVVGVLHAGGSGRAIGLRADMDALPMDERTGLAHASTVPGRMHACGHDGHTTMLLGAARYLAETRRFRGRVALIFQPAEEDIGGARLMVEEGILEHFEIGQVYGLHNDPEVAEGAFDTCPGPIMAAVDTFR